MNATKASNFVFAFQAYLDLRPGHAPGPEEFCGFALAADRGVKFDLEHDGHIYVYFTDGSWADIHEKGIVAHKSVKH